MNITKFKANVAANPFLDATRYTVFIGGPAGWLTEEISLNCSSVDLPGRGFSTVEQYHHGPIRKVPYAELYTDVTTEFYATDSLEERKFFNDWQLLIAGEDYYFSFYKDFVGSVQINTQNKMDQTINKIELIEAWPMEISQIQLGYTQEGLVPVFSVVWAYHHWENK
jgi:hypothetical protein